MMNRRRLLLSAAPLAPLALLGCATTSSGVTLDMAKLYLDDTVNALLAAASVYQVGPPTPTPENWALVQDITSSLETLRDSFDKVQVASDARGIALQILPLLNSLLPIVAVFLPAGLPALIALGIAVITAFIQSLPAPTNAPPEPPAALHDASATIKRRPGRVRH